MVHTHSSLGRDSSHGASRGSPKVSQEAGERGTAGKHLIVVSVGRDRGAGERLRGG